MTQANKKSAQPTAKLASNAATKAAKSTYAAVESTRNSAENVVKLGSAAVKDFMATSADEAQKAQDKVFAMGREGAEQLAKSADTATKMINEAIGLSRGNIETCVECGNMSASLARDISSEIFDSANRIFSDNVELSKEFFACRTLDDMFELQSRMVQNSLDNFFNEATKLSGMMFEYSSEAMEPINERVAEATEQFSKVLAA